MSLHLHEGGLCRGVESFRNQGLYSTYYLVVIYLFSVL